MNSKKIFTVLIMLTGIVIIFAFIVKQFVFFNVSIPAKSMYPAINFGDRATVTRIYNFKNLKRGDIIVFQSREIKDKQGKDEKMIKRLIGLPGEQIDIKKDGSVFVNDKKIDEPYVKNNGGKYGSFKVPEECYFFMGDNRAASFDSRYWKQPYIPQKDIKGKVQFIYFPFSRFRNLK